MKHETSNSLSGHRFLRLSDVKNQVGLGRSAIYDKIKRGDFPAPIHLGARAVGWLSDEICAWTFELFVVGEGKFGKSTLVNCLLGEEQSKVRGLPETRCFLRYVVTDNPSNKVRLFLRAQPGVHDWILSKVGSGRRVKELYEILEY